MTVWFRWFCWVALGGASLPASALIFFGTGDANHNTTAPTGDFAGSGWQWSHSVNYGATAIGPHYLLTAAHLGIGIPSGQTFSYRGLKYPVLGGTNAPKSDLRLVWVGGRLPDYAPLYDRSDEVGQVAVFHGFGGPRGAAVLANADGTGEVRGWHWSASDARLRWGTNVISDTLTSTSGLLGEFLISYFDPGGGDDEVSFSGGDSGGGVFIQDFDGQWKLAATISAVEADFSYTNGPPHFASAMFNRDGFYEYDSSNQTYQLATGVDLHPGVLMEVTRVSAYIDWISTLTAHPPPGAPLVQLLESTSALGPFSEVTAYTANPATHEVTTVDDDRMDRFFQLSGTTNTLSIRRTSGLITLTY